MSLCVHVTSLVHDSNIFLYRIQYPTSVLISYKFFYSVLKWMLAVLLLNHIWIKSIGTMCVCVCVCVCVFVCLYVYIIMTQMLLLS